MYLTAILLAAGRGARFKSKTPKPLVKIDSLPVIIHSLSALSKNPYVSEIIVTVNRRNAPGIKECIKRHRIRKVKRIVLGGRRRQDSVSNALKFIGPQIKLVLIHDAARPFIDKNIISRVIKQAAGCGAAVAGIPVKATIKEVRSQIVAKTLKRNNLWEIQTPQVFKKDLILKAYRRFNRLDATDDATLVERLGKKVCVVRGCYTNLKITTSEDLAVAKAIAGMRKYGI